MQRIFIIAMIYLIYLFLNNLWDITLFVNSWTFEGMGNLITLAGVVSCPFLFFYFLTLFLHPKANCVFDSKHLFTVSRKKSDNSISRLDDIIDYRDALIRYKSREEARSLYLKTNNTLSNLDSNFRMKEFVNSELQFMDRNSGMIYLKNGGETKK